MSHVSVTLRAPAPAPAPVLALALTLCLLLVPALGCSNDDNPLTQVCAAFEPDAAPSAGSVVARSGPESTCDVVELEIVATDIDGVFSASWLLEYDADFLFFAGADVSDSYLADDGTTLLSNFTTNGDVITCAVSRNGSQTTDTIDIAGTQVIARLVFIRIAGSGNSRLEFVDEALLDAGTPPVEVATPPWSGGRVRVN